ncbi:MAG: sensor histidine kinase [Bdellovibrionales bacterium]
MLLEAEHRRHRVEAAALSLLLRQSGLAYLAIVANALVYVVFSWSVVSPNILILWLVVLLVLTTGRYLWAKRVKLRQMEFTPIETRQNLQRYFWGALGSTFIWGLTGWFLREELLVHFTLTIFILAGLAAGVVGAYAIHRLTVVSCLSLLLLPLIVRLAMLKHPQCWSMAALAILFWALMWWVSINLHEQASELVEVGLRNQDLIQRLGDASHEIRSPVTAIMGFAEILGKMPNLDERVRQYAEVIRRNSFYLKRLVDQMLSLSRLEDRSVLEPVEEIALSGFLSEILAVVQRSPTQDRHPIRLEIGESVPKLAKVHPVSLEQILINLLSNAVKFGQNEEVKMSVDILDHDLLRIRVRDRGIGVQPENHSRIFAPFWRENRPESKGSEGTGLGLALSRQLARRMGGDLTLKWSEANKGSEFELTIPISEKT